MKYASSLSLVFCVLVLSYATLFYNDERYPTILALTFSLTILAYALAFCGESDDPQRDLRAFMSGVVLLTSFIALDALIRLLEAIQ